ncbi:hypothetical protein GLE_1931 [Lysobacter enzymogenes]|uniref:Uncharacterized protein n=1 Tax=Lysobacter enzymogenes TaxID=69 RepID=A0A0S2DFL5_LYSEN|nr:hypothetical protein GLE_1931 [Lysobacter enzymogenes]
MGVARKPPRLARGAKFLAESSSNRFRRGFPARTRAIAACAQVLSPCAQASPASAPPQSGAPPGLFALRSDLPRLRASPYGLRAT